jgi:hypothetical protein
MAASSVRRLEPVFDFSYPEGGSGNRGPPPTCITGRPAILGYERFN